MLIKVKEKGHFNPNKYKYYNETVQDKEWPLHGPPMFHSTPFADKFWESLGKEKKDEGSAKMV